MRASPRSVKGFYAQYLKESWPLREKASIDRIFQVHPLSCCGAADCKIFFRGVIAARYGGEEMLVGENVAR